MKKRWTYCKNYQSMTQRPQVSQCFWENDTSRLAVCEFATNLQFVENTLYTKYNKAECSKTRHSCIGVLHELKIISYIVYQYVDFSTGSIL